MAFSQILLGNESMDVQLIRAEDENGEPCVVIRNTKNEYLAAYNNDKHVWWNNTNEPWNWEHWYAYPKGSDGQFIMKSHFGSAIYFNEHEPFVFWQGEFDFDDLEHIVFEGSIIEVPEETPEEAPEEESEEEPEETPEEAPEEESEEEPEEVPEEAPEEEPMPSPKKTKKEPKEPKEKRVKPQAEINNLQEARKLAAFYKNRMKADVETEMANVEDPKVRAKAVKERLNVMYKALTQEEKQEYKTLMAEA